MVASKSASCRCLQLYQQSRRLQQRSRQLLLLLLVVLLLLRQRHQLHLQQRCLAWTVRSCGSACGR
jgi:hypothetical protein